MSRQPPVSSVCDLVDGFARLGHLLLGHERRLAVEVRVGEQARGGAGVVEDVEEELAVVVAHPRAAADDLLELGHRADHAREHDVLAGRGIDAGREQLRGGEDHRRHRLQVLKLAEVALPMLPSSAVTRQT